MGSYSLRRCDVEEVGFLVPSVFIGFEVDGARLEDEGTIFVDHADEGGAAGTAVEPEDDGIVDWAFLGVEEDVVVGGVVGGIEGEIA